MRAKGFVKHRVQFPAKHFIHRKRLLAANRRDLASSLVQGVKPDLPVGLRGRDLNDAKLPQTKRAVAAGASR